MTDTEPGNHGLAHLAAYLAEAGDFDRLARLILGDPGWMERKYAALGGDASFLQDVEFALRPFEDPLPPDQVPVVAQLFAVRHLVRSRVASYENEDLMLMAWLGREHEALSQARLRENLDSRCGGLLSIHRVFRSQGPPNGKLLEEILHWASDIENPRDRSYALSALGTELSLCGEGEAAGFAFRKGEEAITRIAVTLLDRLWALQYLAVSLAQAGRGAQAVQVIGEIRDDFYLALTLTQVAPLARDPEVCSRMLARAEGLIEGMDEDRSPMIWRHLATAFSVAGRERDADRALAELRRLVDPSQDRGAWHLAVALAATARLEDAEALTRGLSPGKPRWEAQSALTAALAKAGASGSAEEVATSIGDPQYRRSALLRLAVQLAETGRLEIARRLFEQAGTIEVRAGTPPDGTMETLRPIFALVQAGRIETIEHWASDPCDLAAACLDTRSLANPDERSLAVATAAARLAARGRIGDALSLISPLEGELQPIKTLKQVEAWAQVALVHARSGDTARALEILHEVRSLINLKLMDNLTRKDIAHRLSTAMALCHAFRLAFATLESVPMEEFLAEVVSWVLGADGLSRRLFLAMLQEVLRILSWKDPSCGIAYERLRTAIGSAPASIPF